MNPPRWLRRLCHRQWKRIQRKVFQWPTDPVKIKTSTIKYSRKKLIRLADINKTSNLMNLLHISPQSLLEEGSTDQINRIPEIVLLNKWLNRWSMIRTPSSRWTSTRICNSRTSQYLLPVEQTSTTWVLILVMPMVCNSRSYPMLLAMGMTL